MDVDFEAKTPNILTFMSDLLATLSIICPRCDYLNAPGSGACVSCQASLSPIAAGTAKTAPPSPLEIPRASPGGAPAPRPSLKVTETRRPGHAVGPPPGVSPPVPSAPRGAIQPPAPNPLLDRPIPASELLKRKSPPAQAAAAPATNFGLSVLQGSRRGERFRLPPLIVIGRRRGNLVFPDDPFLSPQHATLTVKNGRLFLKDDSSASGVFASIAANEIIPPGTFFSAGQHLFHYLGALTPAPPYPSGVLFYGAPFPQGQLAYAVEEVLIGARSGRIAVTTSQILSIGQTSCDLSFPDDPDLAARHCELTLISQGAILRDLSGGLGTFVRIPPGVERPLNVGEMLRVGQEVLRVERIA